MRARSRSGATLVKLADYLAGMEAATTAAELEAAIHAPFNHTYSGPKWARISKVRRVAGERIVSSHPNGRFVPHFGERRTLTLCGETYRVGRGQNSAGVRYVWHFAEHWARTVLVANGFSARASHLIWSTAFDYPHRALAIVADALAGKLPDPRFNRLILWPRRHHGMPVRVNRRTEAKGRAHRDCRCGGWLWDWGCGFNGYANFINWRCDRCPRVFTEYVTDERLSAIRAPARSA